MCRYTGQAKYQIIHRYVRKRHKAKIPCRAEERDTNGITVIQDFRFKTKTAAENRMMARSESLNMA